MVMPTAEAPPGPSYASIRQSLPPIPEGKARVIFFRQHAYAGSIMQIAVTRSGKSDGTNYDGAVFYADVLSGHQEFTLTNPNPMSIGHGTMPIDARAGQVYHIEFYVPGSGVSLPSGGFVNLPGGSHVEENEAETHCSMEICAHLVSGAAAETVIGGLIFTGGNGVPVD
jgi:hypothetical protein